jgi:hypothetical protein
LPDRIGASIRVVRIKWLGWSHHVALKLRKRTPEVGVATSRNPPPLLGRVVLTQVGPISPGNLYLKIGI